MAIHIQRADYHNPTHAAHIGYLMNCYSRDPMGGGAALPGEITENLARELAQRPYALTLLCYDGDEPVGLANCFEGFSTFACRPLLNIHDLVVVNSHRGRGLGAKLLQAVEATARERHCCKITLEVLEGNTTARALYEKLGFGGYQLDPEKGRALFWEKAL